MPIEVDTIQRILDLWDYVEYAPSWGCFLNMYEDGTDALGWHADDDPSIDHDKPIAVVTLGQGRMIHYRGKDEKGSVLYPRTDASSRITIPDERRDAADPRAPYSQVR